MVERRQVFWLSFLSMCFCLCGCDSDYPHRFTHGEVTPNARIVIELPEPRTLAQLYPSYIEVASRAGFIHSKGLTGSRELEELLSESFGGSTGDLRWVEEPNTPSPAQRQVIFLSKFNTREEPARSKRVATSITFMFQRENSDSFTKGEWLEFYVFYDEILPDVFPHAEIRISETRHPAVFTDDEVLRQILEETDIEIPERYLTGNTLQQVWSEQNY